MPESKKIFHKAGMFRCGDTLLPMDKPLIMGILNVTPDSFYDGGRYETDQLIRIHAAQMLSEGADILDIGACSTRPGSREPDPETEQKRLALALSAIRKDFPEAVLSVDTCRSAIASWAIEEFGVQLINDVSGGTMDPRIYEVARDHQVVFILMHMLGTPLTMQDNPSYGNIMGDVMVSLANKVKELEANGVADIWIDPGFGFGKTLDDNYQLLIKLMDFAIFERPILVGISRKSMIYNVIFGSPESSLNGTSVLHAVALLKNADILRVHDVKQTVECMQLIEKVIR